MSASSVTHSPGACLVRALSRVRPVELRRRMVAAGNGAKRDWARRSVVLMKAVGQPRSQTRMSAWGCAARNCCMTAVIVAGAGGGGGGGRGCVQEGGRAGDGPVVGVPRDGEAKVGELGDEELHARGLACA